jgi:ribonucleoside-diphosphate reductase alpha chain
VLDIQIQERVLSDPFASDGLFPAAYREYIYKSKYARWIESEGRREEWGETVERYVSFFEEHLRNNFSYRIDSELYNTIFSSIYNMEVLPSMRALMTAGPAMSKDNVANYNCAYLPVDSIRAFGEAIYILSCGTGVGFSVERHYTEKLPEIPRLVRNWGTSKGGIIVSRVPIVVEDSKYGWADSFRRVLSALYTGVIPTWDISRVRPAGARLKTFGGRASGPEPLVELFEFTIGLFKKAQGRKLRPIEAADIMCKLGEVIVSGGVRRSSLICLSDLHDKEMRHFKSGKWWEDNPHRQLANISAVYEGDLSREDFIEEWGALVASGSGERGIFNRDAAHNQVLRTGRRDVDHRWGCNPCSEILLRPHQFCNLSSVVVREGDSLKGLAKKARIASILGTFQSTLTDFRYLRSEWQRNCEEERLLGVSMTGIYGNRLTRSSSAAILGHLKDEVIDTNRQFAQRLGINPSASTTCVKPEGTGSQLVGTSTGLHPWHSSHFVRTVRNETGDPLTQLMVDQGIPAEDDLMAPGKKTVFSFPVQAPEGAVVRDDMTPIGHLEDWLSWQDNYCEHKPSVTVSVPDEEWGAVGEWVYSHFSKISGISFLPYDGGSYRQAPYQEITKEEYEKKMGDFPRIDFSALKAYEFEDNTKASRELACSSGASCDIV